MAKAILICGKICTGKSTYAENLRKQEKAVILSCDEITLALFDENLGDRHEEVTAKTQKYLFEKSLEVLEAGANVILEWGFWTENSRLNTKKFYTENNFECELHYLDISDEEWEKRISKRNTAKSDGETIAYYVDKNLAEKCISLFEKPTEYDVCVK